ncbi:MAG: hypothetical protein AAFN78_16005 [Pseudomonadota bacterium]
MAAGMQHLDYIDRYTRNIQDVNAGTMRLADFMNPNAPPPPPPNLPPRRMKYINPAVNARSLTVQREFDAAMWYGASIAPAGPTVKRVFQLLYNAGVMYRSGMNWLDWRASGHPVATVLSHGSRVMIQTRGFVAQHKKVLSDVMTDPVWTWLCQPGHIQSRTAATHGLSTSSAKVTMRGHKRHWTEKGGGVSGMYQSAKGAIAGRHYSFNVALGGVNYYNPVSRATTIDQQNGRINAVAIQENGLNGHVYVYYRPPTQKHPYGGLLVGCENAEHGAGINPHTACGHGLGGAQPVSAGGGAKFKAWSGAQGPTKSYTGMFCNLVPFSTDAAATTGWLTNAANIFDADNLDQAPRRVPNIVPPMPT